MSNDFNLRKFLIENRLTFQSHVFEEEKSTFKQILSWLYKSLPEDVMYNLTDKEIGVIARLHEKEWEESRENYSNIEEYFKEVETNGDFHTI